MTRPGRREFEACVFGQRLRLESRPGVFSHGELDEGTLALSEVASIEPTSRCVDLGCGTGAIGVAAALTATRGFALLVDANLRACQVSRRALDQNRVQNAVVVSGEGLTAIRDGAFDRVLTNPPYFSAYRISERFAVDAYRVLEPAGRFYLVTKSPEPHEEILLDIFGGSRSHSRRGYTVLEARK